MADIKLLVMDVDGTLTDGKIYMGLQSEMMKAFNVKDGYAIAHMLPKMGISPVILTGRCSEIVSNRAAELGITLVYQGVKDKVAMLKEICESIGINYGNVAYIGDDLNDIECIEICGLTACPADAVTDVMREVDYICASNGGEGAVREFVEHIAEIG